MIDNSRINIDGIDYSVAKLIECRDFKYVYLINEENTEDFIIQKQIKEDDKTYLVNLDNSQEFDEAMKLIYVEEN